VPNIISYLRILLYTEYNSKINRDENYRWNMSIKPTYEELEKRVKELEAAEQELVKSEQRHRFLIKATTSICWSTDASGGFISPQPSWEKYTGQSWDEHKGFGWTKMIHPEDIDRIQEVWELARHNLSLYNSWGKVWNEDLHQYRDFEVYAVPIMDSDGKLFEWAGFMTDVTEKKQAEEMVRFERDNFKNIFEAMTDGVSIVNQQYEIEYYNQAFKDEFGSLEMKKCYEHFHDRKHICPGCKNFKVFSGKTVRWEWCSPETGKVYDLIDTPIKNADGTLSKLQIFRDITERKRLEREKQENLEKLEKALDEIKILRGIIPICSYCNKIRDERGSWERAEAYISARSEAEFSHSICPECFEKHKDD
jgi:PAS domain S-box-containing protein